MLTVGFAAGVSPVTVVLTGSPVTPSLLGVSVRVVFGSCLSISTVKFPSFPAVTLPTSLPFLLIVTVAPGVVLPLTVVLLLPVLFSAFGLLTVGFTVMVSFAVPVFPAESFTVKVIVCVPTSFGCMFLTVRSKSFSLSVLVV